LQWGFLTGFEEEHDHEHSETAPICAYTMARIDANGSRDEDHDERLVREEYVARFCDVHESRSRETPDGEETLGNGVEVGALVLSADEGLVGAGLRVVVDEVGRNSDLGAHVAKLSGDAEEEGVVVLERLVDVACGFCSHLRLRWC
jgi:hypothetical protein